MSNWYKTAQVLSNKIFVKAKKKEVAVDLDETISNPAEFPKIGEPMEGVAEAMQKLKDEGFQVAIYTCRLNGHQWDKCHKDSVDDSDYEQIVKETEDYLEKHKIPYDRVVRWNEGKPFSDWFVDDKAIHFDGDWEQVVNKIIDLEQSD